MINKKPQAWPVTYVLQNIKRALLWCDDGTDNIFKKNAKGQLIIIKDPDSLAEWQDQFNLKLDEQAIFDIDEYFKILVSLPVNQLIMPDTCSHLTNLCNWLDDLALTLRIYDKLELFTTRKQYLIYNKLYSGNDNVLFKETAEDYHPSFNLTEIKKLRRAVQRAW